MKNSNTILLWRSTFKSNSHAWSSELCPFCSTNLLYKYSDGGGVANHNQRCPLCGWYYHVYFGNMDFGADDYTDFAALKQFDINSSEIALAELGTYLKHKISNVHNLSWRRFEELVEDVFRAYGFRTSLTQQTRDGGADILIMHNERDSIEAIIECKKYANSRKIGIGIVRALVGAAVDWDVRRAYLVTTTDFSVDAMKKAMDYKKRGYDIDLVAMSDLLKMLSVYNKNMPKLSELTEERRREIIVANQRG